MAKLTNKQAQALPDDDPRQQTSAATQNRRQQTAYNAARIQQLADEYRIAEQIANRGLTRSGTAATAKMAASRRRAIGALQTALVTARRNAETPKATPATKKKNTEGYDE